MGACCCSSRFGFCLSPFHPQLCRQLTSLLLHECPSISDRGLLEVGWDTVALLGYSSAAGIQQQCWDTVALFSAATRCPGTIMHLAAARATISLHASPRRVSSSGAHSPAQPSFFLLLPTLTGVPHLAPQQIGERCSQLRALDCTVARRAGGLLLMGEEPDQLGFRALFTIAANCPLLEVRARCWCGAGGPLMRPRVPACQADACDAVHGWWDPAAALV